MTGTGQSVPDAGAEPRRQLEALARAIAQAPLNLVSRADRPRVFDVHVREAMAVTTMLDPPPGTRLLDLGSGGGLPGVVIAILRPDVHVTCMDARAKKMAFVQDVAEQLALDNVVTVAGRAESLARDPQLRGTFSRVVSRAVASASAVAELARGFLSAQGVLTVVKGPRYREEWEGFRTALPTLCYRDPVVREVEAAPRETWLLEAAAEGRAPRWIPRRDGVPQREPLPT